MSNGKSVLAEAGVVVRPAAAVSTRASGNWPALVSAADFVAKKIPAPPELIRGVLYAGATMMFSGASKARKSFAVIDIGLAVATGTRWMDFDTVKSPVIYVNFELQEFSIQKRIVEIAAASEFSVPRNFHLLNLRGCAVDMDSFSKTIGGLIKQTGARLVIVDPYYRISAPSGGEENSNDSQAALLAVMESAVTLHGAALIATHHFAKGNAAAKSSIDRASGGGVFARWPDVIATLTEHEEEDCATMELTLRDFPPVAPFVVRWDFPLWERDDSLEPEKLKTTGGRRKVFSEDDALRALGTGNKTFSEWLKVSGIPETSFRRRIGELTKQGKVTQCGPVYNPAM